MLPEVEVAQKAHPGWMTRDEALSAQQGDLPPPAPPICSVRFDRGKMRYFGCPFADERDPIREGDVMYPRPVLTLNHQIVPAEVDNDPDLLERTVEACKPVCRHVAAGPACIFPPATQVALPVLLPDRTAASAEGVVLAVLGESGEHTAAAAAVTVQPTVLGQLTEDCVTDWPQPRSDCLGYVVALTSVSPAKGSPPSCSGVRVEVDAHTVRRRPRPLQLLRCDQCGVGHNLWICLTCGHLACGRAHNIGVRAGGNGHALQHFLESGHPTCAKLGAISVDSCDVHCYKCLDEVQHQHLFTSLYRFGIDMRLQRATAYSLAEMQVLHETPVPPSSRSWVRCNAMEADRAYCRDVLRQGNARTAVAAPRGARCGTLSALPLDMLACIALTVGDLPCAVRHLGTICRAWRWVLVMAVRFSSGVDLTRSDAPSRFLLHADVAGLRTLTWHSAAPAPELVEALPALLPSLRVLSVGNWLASPRVSPPAPADRPGKYKLLSPTPLQVGPELRSAHVLWLQGEQEVEVAEVAVVGRTRTVRGRCASPDGWLTLFDPHTGRCNAAPASRALEAAAWRRAMMKELVSYQGPGAQVRFVSGTQTLYGVVRDVEERPDDYPEPCSMVQTLENHDPNVVRMPSSRLQPVGATIAALRTYVRADGAPLLKLLQVLPKMSNLICLSLQSFVDSYYFDVFFNARATEGAAALLPQLQTLDIFNLNLRDSTLRQLLRDCPGVKALRMGVTQLPHIQDLIGDRVAHDRIMTTGSHIAIVRETLPGLQFLDWLLSPRVREFPTATAGCVDNLLQLSRLQTCFWTNGCAEELVRRLLADDALLPALTRVDTCGLCPDAETASPAALDGRVGLLQQLLRSRPRLRIVCDPSVQLRLRGSGDGARLLQPSDMRDAFSNEHIPDARGSTADDIIQQIRT
eukprot:TRINITY_DN2578_c3_g4_i1.p1 TRINITY_DN2578_c3_g4~~TRINITY_DN2578_c3_g4_i1.p1  ORF type:complete len:917 (+),score=334.58 TRINITY_DN2578_c3_g4_i1:67-2817(+)